MMSVADLPKSPGVSVITVRVPSAVPIGDNVPLEVVAGSQAVHSQVVTIGIAFRRPKRVLGLFRSCPEGGPWLNQEAAATALESPRNWLR